jgi:hypothetical protein
MRGSLLDHSLPSAVISVQPHPHGKANDTHVQHLRDLKQVCAQSGFPAVAFCADGNTAYSSLMNPIYQSIHGVKENGAYPEPFITDFLHEMKCLRNRVADHQLALSASSTQIIDAVELSDVLGIPQSLTKKTCGSQLKGKLTLNTFRLANVVTLAESGHSHAAFFFLPITFWRVAIQALKVPQVVRWQHLEADSNILSESLKNTMSRSFLVSVPKMNLRSFSERKILSKS